MAMMAMTTSSSMAVKPRRSLGRGMAGAPLLGWRVDPDFAVFAASMPAPSGEATQFPMTYESRRLARRRRPYRRQRLGWVEPLPEESAVFGLVDALEPHAV